MNDRAPQHTDRHDTWNESATSLLEQLEPLLSAEVEHDAWRRATEFVARYFSADLSASLEFFGADRAAFRSSNFDEVADGFEFAVAPDSQAAFIRSFDQVCASNDIMIDPRVVEYYEGSF